jgi:hypothetical protein
MGRLRLTARKSRAPASRVRVVLGGRPQAAVLIRAWVARPACLASLVLAVAACGGTGSSSSESAGPRERPLAEGLALLPDEPELRRHVLVSDLERLRRAYPAPGERRAAFVGVWLPDALVGADRALWRKSFGLRLNDISSFASAGFHPAELTVAEGEFSPELIRGALRRSGYRAAGRTLMRGADGSVASSTAAGQLSLSALNRVIASPTRVTAASTSELLRAARSPSTTLATDRDFAAAADALDPITSAIVLDANLVQPPSGVPTPILTAFAACLVAVGIDDLGPSSRTIKIALIYESSDQARADAALIERDLPSTSLPGARGTTFSDLASEWRVTADDRAIVVSALLPPNSNPGTWRSLIDRGDLAVLVRPPG